MLYSNDAGTRTSFTLSESLADFDYADIGYFGNLGGGDSYMIARVYGPDGKSVNLHYADYIDGTIQLGCTSLVLSGKTATFRGYWYINFSNGAVSYGPGTQATPNVHVYKVVGYRKLA